MTRIRLGARTACALTLLATTTALVAPVTTLASASAATPTGHASAGASVASSVAAPRPLAVTAVAWSDQDGNPGWVLTYPVPDALGGLGAAAGASASDPSRGTSTAGATLDQDPIDWAQGEVFVPAASHYSGSDGTTAVANDVGTQLCVYLRVPSTPEAIATFGGSAGSGWIAAYAGCTTLSAPATSAVPRFSTQGVTALSWAHRVGHGAVVTAGTVLTLRMASVFPAPDTTSIQWYADGLRVARAHATHLRVTRALRGATLSVRVTVTHRNYAVRTLRSAGVTAH